ncbi:hypothetical protein tpqmel_0381 [Candidatus Gastranaerophilus sp. (ex Termes propinquus)]|nr:hypothetical protein tpqmel_0381 [Candidatus Gastranaerophilus sp. (ex Termes propinquus)]
MVFFDNLKGKEEENQTEKLRQEREKIKKNLSNTLSAQGFTNIEVLRVINVIENAEREIQVIKDSLIGTNINNTDADPMKVLHDGRVKIHEREVRLGQEIKDMVEKIRNEKKRG